MEWIYDDGGRSDYFRANAGDCVTRAIAIATGRDYKEVYNTIKKIIGYTPRNGVSKKDTQKVMKHFGGVWKPCMKIGTGCKVHLTESELPEGTIICSVTHHVVCIKDRVIYDNHNPSRFGERCVYGYWVFSKEIEKPKEITTYGTIKKLGIKTVVDLPYLLKQAGFKEGDFVDITIKKRL